MKVVLVFVLIFLNAAFLTWQLHRPAPPRERPVPSADPGVERLILVDEVDELPEPRSPPPKPEARGASAAAPVPASELSVAVESKDMPESQPHCGTVGPLDDRRAATRLADRLARLDAETQLRKGEVPVERYWVMLPPMASRAAASRVEQALKRRGVRDLQVLGADDRENAISLGLYQQRESADRRVRQIRSMGYDPKLEIVERARTAYWIDYRVLQAPEAQWQVALVRYPQVQREARPCQ